MKPRLWVVGLAAALAMPLAAAQAADYEVKMLNKGVAGAMVFEPAFLQVEPGDSVTFVPTDKGHDAVSIKGMVPEGAAPFAGKMNQELTVVFDTPGVYGVKCVPHYGMGMVALIVAGDPGNVAEATAVKHPGKAKVAFAGLFEELATQLASQ
ncbi:MAG TPA: pseudoazurin [Rhodospirillales bacterium]